MDVGIFLAAFGISLLELSEAGAVAVIYRGIFNSNKPYIYAILGVLTVLIPTFLLGSFISLLPLNYVLIAAGIILFYFGYRLLRSARRSIKGLRKPHEKEKEESIAVVYTIGATEAFEAALVIIALIPQNYVSTLIGTLSASLVVIALTIILKSQIMKIRVPQLKYALSALLFSLGTLWFGEVFIGIDEIFLPLFFVVYLAVNYALIRI
ncbi:hypothetical protein [Acidianus brierleyi]|uniref:Uncharacterized protein n=1 Tax=Acidianus brierleyi TaxID=41673 RepID=A0A2U9IGM2_9CREN|nr:hypothetical protein [Acidianus brierleyi]AWR95149.1 hypothetical protein DFR85_11625 [Acidianus brierleyi]